MDCIHYQAGHQEVFKFYGVQNDVIDGLFPRVLTPPIESVTFKGACARSELKMFKF